MQDKLPGSLQDKFNDFGSAPSEQLWNNIAANLDEDKKRRGAFWWWLLGAAAVVTLFFGVYQLGYNNGVSENESVVVENKSQHSNENIQNSNNQIPNENGQENAISSEQNLANQNNDEQNSETLTNSENENSEHDSSNNRVAKSTNLQITNIPQRDRQHSSLVESFVIKPDADISEKFSPENVNYTSEIKKMSVPEISQINHSISEPQLNFEPLVEIQNPSPNNKWEIGFSIGTLKSLSYTSSQNMMLDSSASLSSLDNLNQNNSIEGTGISSYSNLSESQANITRPLQLEMTFARDFGRRWNFQTGISLGLLFSNNHYSSNNLTNVRSRFLSIGIPIHFNYDIIRRQRLSFYSGIGVNYEMPFFESVKTSYSISALESTSTKDFTKGYMISGQLNVGLRYNLNENLKLDFRPNFRYYIHQSMQSVYPALERKIWAGASLGLVWQL